MTRNSALSRYRIKNRLLREERVSASLIGRVLCEHYTKEELSKIIKNIGASDLAKLNYDEKSKLLAWDESLSEVIDFHALPADIQAKLATNEYWLRKVRFGEYTSKQFRSFLTKCNQTADVISFIWKEYPNQREEMVGGFYNHPSLWNALLRRRPKTGVKLFDITKARNPTYLRGMIYNHPIIMSNATLKQMGDSVVPPETWCRLIGDIAPQKRFHFPDGTKDWINKRVFMRKLQGKRFKPFKEWEEGLR